MSGPASAAIRAIVIDDTPDLRLLVRMTLERDGDIVVVAEAGDGLEGVALSIAHQPDLVFLDLAMPRMDGLEALPQILKRCPHAKVVVLSGFEAGSMRDNALASGAHAYLQKGVAPSEILALAREVIGRGSATELVSMPTGDDVGRRGDGEQAQGGVAGEAPGPVGLRSRVDAEAPARLLAISPAPAWLFDVPANDAAGDPGLRYANPAAARVAALPSIDPGARLSTLSGPLSRLYAAHLGVLCSGEQISAELDMAGERHQVRMVLVDADLVVLLWPPG